MFCSQCGTETQTHARFCQKCGHTLSSGTTQPTASVQVASQKTAIWNPLTVQSWSFVFSPIFGAYITMLNWRSLQEPEKAASSKNWIYASIGMVMLNFFIVTFMNTNKNIVFGAYALSFLFLMTWIVVSQSIQVRYVKEKFGKNYIHKPWANVLLLSIAALIGFIAFATVVNIIGNAINNRI